MEAESLFDQLLSRYKVPIAAGVIGAVLLIAGVISSGIIPETFKNVSPQASFVKSTAVAESKTAFISSAVVKVDVSGAVKNPGVYSLPVNSRVEEAIKAAGGLLEDADTVFVSKQLNLAQKISDGMKVYIPKTGEAGSGPVVAGASVEAQGSLINLNTSSIADLDKLPGVGPVTAQKIINKRPYGSIGELWTKKVVSRTAYEKIKNLVSTY